MSDMSNLNDRMKNSSIRKDVEIGDDILKLLGDSEPSKGKKSSGRKTEVKVDENVSDNTSTDTTPSVDSSKGGMREFLLCLIIIVVCFGVATIYNFFAFGKGNDFLHHKSAKTAEKTIEETEDDNVEVAEAAEEDSNGYQETELAPVEVDDEEYVEEDSAEVTEEEYSEEEAEEEEVEEEEVEPETEESEYILEGSDSRYIEKSELKGMSAEECRLARNEIYARHGRKFDDDGLRAYFESKDWYEGSISPSSFKENMLNDYEIYNRDLIVEYEGDMGYR